MQYRLDTDGTKLQLLADNTMVHVLHATVRHTKRPFVAPTAALLYQDTVIQPSTDAEGPQGLLFQLDAPPDGMEVTKWVSPLPIDPRLTVYDTVFNTRNQTAYMAVANTSSEPVHLPAGLRVGSATNFNEGEYLGSNDDGVGRLAYTDLLDAPKGIVA